MATKKTALSKVTQVPVLPTYEATKNLKQYLQAFEAALPEDEQALLRGGLECMATEILSIIQAGIYFKKLRDNTEHGRFKTVLAECGVHPRYVQERMQIAEKFSQVDTSNFQHSSKLGYSKIRKIATWDVEDIVGFFEGDEVHGITIDQAQDMSKQEFEAQIKANQDDTKALHKELLNKEEDLIELEKENEVLRRRINGDSMANDWPDVVVKSRHESGAILEQNNLGIDVLEKLVNELTEQQKSLKPLEYNVGFSSIFHNLNAIMARGQNLLNTINEDYQGTQELNQDENIVPLSKAEINIARQRSSSLNQLFLRGQMDREEKRQRNKAPRPGRPVKVTKESVA